ncbi:MAG: hypothetical protein IJM64_06580 [Ottowia sp.]|nr:hypothetical protein [Ottowia sp.]
MAADIGYSRDITRRQIARSGFHAATRGNKVDIQSVASAHCSKAEVATRLYASAVVSADSIGESLRRSNGARRFNPAVCALEDNAVSTDIALHFQSGVAVRAQLATALLLHALVKAHGIASSCGTGCYHNVWQPNVPAGLADPTIAVQIALQGSSFKHKFTAGKMGVFGCAASLDGLRTVVFDGGVAGFLAGVDDVTRAVGQHFVDPGTRPGRRSEQGGKQGSA